MSCLDVDVIQGFAEGRLGPEELSVVEEHARWCRPCQELLTVGVAAQSQAGPDAAAEPDGDSPGMLPRGATVGRYTILALVGRGAMGEVYAAYDPELDRRIALKLLHEGNPFSESRATKRARLLREAKAIARLSHPNVIVVHDAGTVGDRVFIAMEFIAGHTLADLLRREPRPWREVLDLFIAAGRGLSAAHAAGVVHRDFKPQNVMVAADGGVRVMDFGLASEPGPSEVEGPVAVPSSLAAPADSSLTRTGALIGTPAYMAPEQFHAAGADARSDQFSFCVALYEALYRERPFAGDTLQDLMNSVTAGGARPPPSGNRTPGWLRKILLRGLAVHPDQRYPSMAALLAALRADPSSRQKRWLMVSVGIGAVIGVGAMGRQIVRHPGHICEGGASHLAGTWDAGETAPLRQRIHRAFVATGSLAGERAFAGVESLLDRYATDWTSMYRETCEATHVLGEQSAEVLDLRMDCLQKRLEHVRALTSVLASANASVVDNAVQAASDLPSLTPCSDVKALRAILPPPENAEARRRVDVLRAEAAQLIALKDAGQCSAAVAKAKGLIQAVREAGYMPLVAETLNGVAMLGNTCADPAVSGERAREAYYAAIEAHDDRAATLAALVFAMLAVNRLGDLPTGRDWVRISRATLRRLGSDPLLESWVLGAEGITLHAEGRHAEAIKAEQDAVELLQRLRGPEHVYTLVALENLGNGLTEARRLAEGLEVTTRAMVGFERVLGPQNTWVATGASNRGETLNLLHRYPEARQAYQRAIDIWRSEKATPVLIAWGLTGLGLAYLGEDRPSDAVQPLQEALRIRLAEHVDAGHLGEVRFALARAVWASGGDPARARGLALAARPDFAGSGHESQRSEVDAWLAARPSRARSGSSRLSASR